MVGVGVNGVAADVLDRIDDFEISAGDDDRADVGLHGAAPDMDDHRHPVYIGDRLVGQADRGQTRGNDDDGI